MNTSKSAWAGFAVAVILGAAVGSACSSSATRAATSPSPASASGASTGSATGSAPGSAPGSPDSSSASGAAVGGHDARAFTCESFATSDLLKALQTVVPGTTAGPVKTERLADEFGSPLSCDYLFASNRYPSLAATVAEGQDITFLVRISDGIVAGAIPAKAVTDAFGKARDLANKDASGDAKSDHQSRFTHVSGIGDDAFFNDYFTRNAGVNEAVASDMSILRSSLPMTVEVDMDYSVQQAAATTAPSGTADPFDAATMHAMSTAVANAIIAKL